MKGKKALPSAPSIASTASKRHTRRTIHREIDLLGMGDRLTDKDILCWLNEKLYHMEMDDPRVWTLALSYIKRSSRWTQAVESTPQWTTWVGAIAIFSWSTTMTNKGCIGLIVA